MKRILKVVYESTAGRKLGRYKYATVFLADHLLYLKEKLFGITLPDLRSYAFEVVKKKFFKSTRKKRMSENGKLQRFLKYHPRFSLRDPEKKSFNN